MAGVGAKNFIQVSYLGNMGPSTWGIFRCFPMLVSRKRNKKQNSWILLWNASIASGGSATSPVNCFYLIANKICYPVQADWEWEQQRRKDSVLKTSFFLFLQWSFSGWKGMLLECILFAMKWLLLFSQYLLCICVCVCTSYIHTHLPHPELKPWAHEEKPSLLWCFLLWTLCLSWSCRALCEHAKERCESVLGIVGLQWPEDTDCGQFPEEESDNQTCLMPDQDVEG